MLATALAPTTRRDDNDHQRLCKMRVAAMLASRDRTRAVLAAIGIAMREWAHVATRNDSALGATFGRHACDWTQQHERRYQAALAEIAAARRNETGALRAKLARQIAAIAAEIVRQHGA